VSVASGSELVAGPHVVETYPVTVDRAVRGTRRLTVRRFRDVRRADNAGDATEVPRSVSLVDCDIHPTLTHPELLKRIAGAGERHLERFGRRTPMITEFYPRTANAGFRLDSWPEAPGGFPGSDLGLLRTQLLDEFGIDYGILNCLGLLSCHEVPALAAEITRVLND